MSEFKKYDSDDKFTAYHVRLTKDAEVFPSKDPQRGPLVKLTFVSSSRREGTKDQFVECKVRDRDANAAQYLKKLDVVTIEGKPLWEEYKDKVYFKLDNAEVHLPIALLGSLKERGFEPGAKGGAPRPAARPAPRPAPRPATRPVEDVDFGDE